MHRLRVGLRQRGRARQTDRRDRIRHPNVRMRLPFHVHVPQNAVDQEASRRSEIPIKIIFDQNILVLRILLARQLSTTSRDPLVEWDNDKPTLVALREIEEGLIDQETLEKTLEEDLLLDEFSVPNNQEKENIG